MRIITEPRDQGERLVARLREMIDYETMVRDVQVRCIVLTNDEYRIYREYLARMTGFPAPQNRGWSALGGHKPPNGPLAGSTPASEYRSTNTYFDGYRVIREGEVMP